MIGKPSWNKGIKLPYPIWNKGKKLPSLSEETKNKISLANKGKNLGRIHTAEHRKKNSEAKKGNQYALGLKHTLETRKKISLANTGKKQSVESINKRVGHFKGEKHYKWKGDNVGYRTLHKWVEIQLGKPHFCEDCGNKELKHRQYHWANISKQYKRIITDWRRLCGKCHKAFDNRAQSANL